MPVNVFTAGTISSDPIIRMQEYKCNVELRIRSSEKSKSRFVPNQEPRSEEHVLRFNGNDFPEDEFVEWDNGTPISVTGTLQYDPALNSKAFIKVDDFEVQGMVS